MGGDPGLAPEQLRALDSLKAVPGIEGFYLAGGGAVAYHLGHRRSLDIDLFSATPAIDLDAVRSAATARIPSARVLEATDVTLRMLVSGTAVDLVRYPYPPLDPPAAGPAGFRVAGLRDLAAMKLAAIARRGIRRDFWDLAAILRSGMDLGEAGAAYVSRFGLAEADLYHVARALTYFADAERDPVLPAGMTGTDWEGIKALIRAAAPRLLESP